jgi:hypothetical protein
MRGRRDPAPLGDVLRVILGRLGVGDLEQWNRIRDEWTDVAPAPWNGQAKPLSFTDGVLVVEAITPAAVGILRYGIAGLQQALSARYGEGVVREVRLRSPGPGRRA